MYVEIQGYVSPMMAVGSRSVLQGSKLASWLSTIYTLDIGRINELMNDKDQYQK